jgi:YidC/Oxa1 family membrane protein insertase
MEQTRVLAAIVLSFLVFLVWELVVVDKKPQQLANKPDQAYQKPETAPPEALPQQVLAEKENGAIAVEPQSVDRPARTIIVDTPLYQARISEHGALLTSFQLKKYNETKKPDSPLLEMIDRKGVFGTLGLDFEKSTVGSLQNARFISNHSSDRVQVTSESQKLTFVNVSENGLVVEKSFVFSPDTYLIDLHVAIVNRSDTAFQDSLILSLSKVVPENEATYGFVGPSALIDKKLEQVKIKKIKDKSAFNGNIAWIAYQDRYFISSILLENPEDGTFRLKMIDSKKLLNQYIRPETTFSPGSRTDFTYQIYFGPKDSKILKSFNKGLEKAVHFGFFDFIAKPFVWVMNQIYRVVPNYGIAIILLTLLIKILLWPLGTKSYKAMNEMKKIQPLMAEIKEKYKDDKKKMNEETMGLYRTYKVNPMGGCLPMLVQLPVFFALYRMLYEAIELRHAPFFGWINDLSAPDRLFQFGFSIPFMQPPYGIPVLTLVMGATMFLQQKMSPPIGDPAQAKIMMLMPIFFTVIFINFSSGLVLYWLVNNVLSIAQQYYIQKKYA